MSWGEEPTVHMQVLPHGFPVVVTVDGDSGMDLRAAIAEGEELAIGPDDSVLIPAGFMLAIPNLYEGQVRSRSGLGTRERLVVTQGIGTIDASYRGEVFLPMHNIGRQPFLVRRGMRLAQLVIAPVCRPKFWLVPTLEASTRGAGGFGSTGVG